MQSDCNLVIYDNNNQPIWATSTQNSPVRPCRLMLQNSGSLSVINSLDQVLWQSSSTTPAKNLTTASLTTKSISKISII